MPELATIYDYMRAHATMLGERILRNTRLCIRSMLRSLRGLTGSCDDRFRRRRLPSWAL
jgi:hypothetical protein